MDVLSISGILIAIFALVLGQFLEGGHIGSLLRLTSGFIVVGGTLGATLLSAPREDLRRAWQLMRGVFVRVQRNEEATVESFAKMAAMARKDGIVALEEMTGSIEDPFLSRAILHVVDGANEQILREVLETELDVRMGEDLAAASVFDIAGGYAPTIGILGAVFGLIHAMDSLSDPEQLGQGIAQAFVATVYGVGLANLLLLPVAANLRRRIAQQRTHGEIIIEGALALQSGSHPQTMRTRLLAYVSRVHQERSRP